MSILYNQAHLSDLHKQSKALRQIGQIVESGKPIKFGLNPFPIILIIILIIVVVGSLVGIKDYLNGGSSSTIPSEQPQYPVQESPSLPVAIDPSWALIPISLGVYQPPVQISSDTTGIPAFEGLSGTPGRLACQDGYVGFQIPLGVNAVYVMAVDPTGVTIDAPPLLRGWVNVYCGEPRELIVFAQ